MLPFTDVPATGNYVTYIAGKRSGNFWPGSPISHKILIRDSVGGASVNGNIIKRPRDRIPKGITCTVGYRKFGPAHRFILAGGLDHSSSKH